MSDPYRTPAIVETARQRADRLRTLYYNVAAGQTPSDPEKRKQAMDYLAELERRWHAAEGAAQREAGR